MASGLPVVAPNAGGVLSYANDGNAWLAKPDAASFAAAAQSVFEDPAATLEKVRQARKAAEGHDWSIVAERFFELLDTLHFEGFRIAQPPLGAAIDEWRALRPQAASR
jgi:glycosyltransferase involved in cell wall biosynthesis